MEKYKITYTDNKHSYVQIDNGILWLKISKRLKRRKKQHDEVVKILLEKGQILLKKYDKKTIIGKKELLVWGKKVDEKISKKYNKEEIKNFLKQKLYDYVYPQVQDLSQKLGFGEISIRINKVKSKRGSCSYDNKLMFNLNLIHLPKKYTDYVVVHECCHFVHKNHSSEFWNLVSKYCPNYKIIKKDMKKYQIGCFF